MASRHYSLLLLRHFVAIRLSRFLCGRKLENGVAKYPLIITNHRSRTLKSI